MLWVVAGRIVAQTDPESVREWFPTLGTGAGVAVLFALLLRSLLAQGRDFRAQLTEWREMVNVAQAREQTALTRVDAAFGEAELARSEARKATREAVKCHQERNEMQRDLDRLRSVVATQQAQITAQAGVVADLQRTLERLHPGGTP